MSPNVNDLKSSKFLTKNDVEPAVLVTIKSYEELNVAMESQASEMKWTLSFEELDKPLVLNSTNGFLIKAITGSGEFDDWIGKKVVLYNDKAVSFGNQITGGIRIRASRRPQDILEAPDPDSDISNPEYVGDDPPPPENDGIPF